MSTPKPLLIAEDLLQEPSREKRSLAVRHCATALAEKLQTSIDLAYVENIYSSYPKGPNPFKKLVHAYLKEQKVKLSRIAKTLKVPVQTLSLEGDPAKEILKLAGKNSKIEMIVLGTHGRSGWSRVLLGSVAEEVIRHSSIPVMSVGPNAQKMASKFLKSSPVKILIPTSLSLNSKRAENYGLDLAQRLGAQVIFFHSMQDALEPLLRVSFSKPHSVPAIREYIEDTKVLLLKQLAQRVQVANKIGVTASGVLDDETFSASASILKQLSRSKSSFIVMGTHGRSLATGFFFGRTAREMILNSPTPIVTIQSKSE